MRYDRRYGRVLSIITDPVIPRHPEDGPALCHLCQRSVMLSGGFLEHVINELFQAARRARARYTPPLSDGPGHGTGSTRGPTGTDPGMPPSNQAKDEG